MKKIPILQRKLEACDSLDHIGVIFVEPNDLIPFIDDNLVQVQACCAQFQMDDFKQGEVKAGGAQQKQQIIHGQLNKEYTDRRKHLESSDVKMKIKNKQFSCFLNKLRYSARIAIKLKDLNCSVKKQQGPLKQNQDVFQQFKNQLELQKKIKYIATNIFQGQCQNIVIVTPSKSLISKLVYKRYELVQVSVEDPQDQNLYQSLFTIATKLRVISLYKLHFYIPMQRQRQEFQKNICIGDITPLGLLSIVKQLKQRYPLQRLREIECVVFQSLKEMQVDGDLIKIVNNKLKQMQKSHKICFNSLGKKIIYKDESSNKIFITFPDVTSLDTFLKKYYLSRPCLPIPQITAIFTYNLTVEQHFVNAFPLQLSKEAVQKYIDLAERVSMIPSQSLPLFRLTDLIPQIYKNIEIWNKNIHKKYSLQPQTIKNVVGELMKIGTLIDMCTTRTIYRDMNFTNILKNEKNELFLVDFEMISVGTFVLDLVFLLNDKYHYLEDQIVYHGLIYFWRKQKEKKPIQFIQIQTMFYQCSYFLTFRWLLQLTKIYIKDQQSFHMNLRVLLLQLFRSTIRMRKLIDSERYKTIYETTLKLMGGFLDLYSKIWKRQNLEPIAEKIYACVGLSTSEQFAVCQKIKKVERNSGKSIEQINYEQILKVQQQTHSDLILHDQDYKKQITVLKLLIRLFKETVSTFIIIGCPSGLSFLFFQLFGFSVTSLLSQNNQQSKNRLIHQLNSAITIRSNEFQSLQNRILSNRNVNNLTAIILSAGHGSRLGYKHKALIRIGGKTLIERWVEQIIQTGVTQIIIAQLDSRIQIVRELLSKYTCDYPIRILYKSFKAPIGAGRTMLQCSKIVETQNFFSISCDLFSNFELRKFWLPVQFDASILGIKFNQGIFYTDKESQMLKIIDHQYKGQFTTFGGLGLFKAKEFIEIGENLSLDSCEFGEILKYLAKYGKVKVMQLKNSFLFNINEQKDLEEAIRIYQNSFIHNI